MYLSSRGPSWRHGARWLARVLGLPSLFAVHIDTVMIDIVWAVLGAVVLLATLSLLRRRRYLG